MFCNRCGTEVQFGFVTRPKCGRRIGDPVGGVALKTGAAFAHPGNLVDGDRGTVFDRSGGLMTFGQSLHFMVHEQEPWPGLWQVLLITASGTLVILAAPPTDGYGGAMWGLASVGG